MDRFSGSLSLRHPKWEQDPKHRAGVPGIPSALFGTELSGFLPGFKIKMHNFLKEAGCRRERRTNLFPADKLSIDFNGGSSELGDPLFLQNGSACYL
jgi:hypothetical protein